VRHGRGARELELPDRLLRQAIGLGDALMLAQMLDPGFDQEGLDEAALLRRILIDAPGIGAVALSFMADLRQRREEAVAALRIDAVLDRDEDRAARRGDIAVGDRRRPVERRREIDLGGGLQPPAAAAAAASRRAKAAAIRCAAGRPSTAPTSPQAALPSDRAPKNTVT